MKSYSVLALILLFALNYAENCHYLLNFHLETVITSSDGQTISKYQSDTFKQGDILFIKNLRLENTGSCPLPASMLKIEIVKPSGQTKNFCGNFNFPVVNPTQTVSFAPQTSFQKERNVVSCGVNLDEIGVYHLRWEDKLNFSSPAGTAVVSGGNLIVNGLNNDFTFDVHSKAELDALEAAKTSRDISILSLIVAILATVFGVSSLKEWLKKRR